MALPGLGLLSKFAGNRPRAYLPGVRRVNLDPTTRNPYGRSAVAYQRANFMPFSMITTTQGGGFMSKEGTARSFQVARSPRRIIRPRMMRQILTPRFNPAVAQAAPKALHKGGFIGPTIRHQGLGAVQQTERLFDTQAGIASPLFKAKEKLSEARKKGRKQLAPPTLL